MVNNKLSSPEIQYTILAITSSRMRILQLLYWVFSFTVYTTTSIFDDTGIKTTTTVDSIDIFVYGLLAMLLILI
jgi:hypothetical protein